MKELAKGDVVVLDPEEHPVRVEIVELLGPGKTEAGQVESLRYKTSLMDGSYKNTTSVLGHYELLDEVARGEARVERASQRRLVVVEARRLAMRSIKRELDEENAKYDVICRELEKARERKARAVRQMVEGGEKLTRKAERVEKLKQELREFEEWDPTSS